ncbi:unnamed protein product, partial [Mesorhabditis spiculigera]
PMLMELQFRNKSERAKWMDTFDKGIQKAPKTVRMPPRRTDAQTAKEREKEEKRQREAEEGWVRRLEQHFEERKDAEGAIAEYLDKRMAWFDRLRSIVNEMPFKNRQDIPDKVKAAVRQRFRELRQARVEPISKLVAKCTAARDQDLLDFFDDAAEVQNVEDDSGSDSSGSESKNLPRRVQTFHGTSNPRKEKGSFRRHTTVPKMLSLHSASTSSAGMELMRSREEDIEEVSDEEPSTVSTRSDGPSRARGDEVAQMTQRLPLSMSLRARKAATQIIKENADLRHINNTLRQDLALSKTALSLYEKSRVAPLGSNGNGCPSVPAAETHEALRKKEQELRDGESKLNQDREDLEAKKQHLEERLRVKEEELNEKWRTLLERETILHANHMNNDRNSTPPAMTRLISPTCAGRKEQAAVQDSY